MLSTDQLCTLAGLTCNEVEACFYPCLCYVQDYVISFMILGRYGQPYLIGIAPRFLPAGKISHPQGDTYISMLSIAVATQMQRGPGRNVREVIKL
jgi:hypothetical protein